MSEVLDGVAAVVLCGGRGSRMGGLTSDRPKPLLPVRGQPILRYILNALRHRGIRRAVLPIGYRGEEIERFVGTFAPGGSLDVLCVPTGEDARISDRLRRILDHLPATGEVLLTNGDTVFDFAFDRAVQHHRAGSRKVTLCTVSIRSQFGLVLRQADRVVGFERNAPISHLAVRGREDLVGLINAGIAVVDLADLRGWLAAGVDERADSFEELYYGERCAAGDAGVYEIEGFWKNFDTAKDLEDAGHPDIAPLLDGLVRSGLAP